MRLGRNWKWEREWDVTLKVDIKNKNAIINKKEIIFKYKNMIMKGGWECGGSVYGRWKVGGNNHDTFRKIK